MTDKLLLKQIDRILQGAGIPVFNKGQLQVHNEIRKRTVKELFELFKRSEK